MPPVLLVCLSKGRIEGTDEIPQGLAAHTVGTPLLGAVEDPGVLLYIPEQ